MLTTCPHSHLQRHHSLKTLLILQGLTRSMGVNRPNFLPVKSFARPRGIAFSMLFALRQFWVVIYIADDLILHMADARERLPAIRAHVTPHKAKAAGVKFAYGVEDDPGDVQPDDVALKNFRAVLVGQAGKLTDSVS